MPTVRGMVTDYVIINVTLIAEFSSKLFAFQVCCIVYYKKVKQFSKPAKSVLFPFLVRETDLQIIEFVCPYI